MGNSASSSTPSLGYPRSMAAGLLPLLFLLGTSAGQELSAARQLQTDDQWTQLGQNLDGESSGDTFGRTMAISADGKTLAIGAVADDVGALTEAGSVKVFRYDPVDGEFDQLGSTIVGTINDNVGITALSADGSILAVGAPQGGSGWPGEVRIYKWDGSDYSQIGATLSGSSDRGRFGHSVDLSADGTVLAVGIRAAGAVQVYICDVVVTSNGCAKRGSLISGDSSGDSPGDYFGNAVSLSTDGNILVVGAPWHNFNGVYSGQVKVFEYVDNKYEERGSAIYGMANDFVGGDVALSGDGGMLAVGAGQRAGNGVGYVKMYSFNGTEYIQLGNTLEGNVDGDEFGSSVDVSSDASIVAVGAQQFGNTGDGFVQMYAFDGAQYEPMGDAIPGLGNLGGEGDRFGWGVALSGDGTTAMGAAIWSVVGGGRSGQVRVFTSPPGPWKINFLGLNANFGVDSDKELVLDYEIGKDRLYEAMLYEGDCSTNITGSVIDAPEVSLSPKNAKFQALTLSYDINKTMLANSTIWNTTASDFKLCQVVRLITDTVPVMVIQEQKHVLTIGMDMTVNWKLIATLAAGIVGNVTDSVDVQSYIEACKCSGLSFLCNQDDLVANDELMVCIWSVSSDVIVDSLESMTAAQGNADMDIIKNGDVMFQSFSSKTYSKEKNGVMVSTRVPLNLFDYDSAGAEVTISGVVATQLAGSSARRLQANDFGGDVNADEEAAFSVKVGLKGEMESGEENVKAVTNSAIIVASKGFVALSMLLVVAYPMW